MTVISSNTLIDFVNIQLTKSSSCLEYATGSRFEGSIKDNQAYGFGKFIWPNNEYFEGFYHDGLRNKIGIQKWCDEDLYFGEFFNDKMHGWGFYRWSNNDIYEGSFYTDFRHGFGIYRSNDNTRFEGTFYKNKREGFGVFYYANGNVFQGLYKDNYRCGPGILQYTNGHQDIGMWHRNSLLKLINKQEEIFSIQQFSDLITLYSNIDSESSFYFHSNNKENNLQNPFDNILRYKITKPQSIQTLSSIIDKDDFNFNWLIDENINENRLNLLVEPDLSNNDAIDVQDQLSNNSNDRNLDQNELGENEPPINQPMTIEEIEKQQISDPHEDESRKEYFEIDSDFSEFFSNLKIRNNQVPVMEKITDHLNKFSSYIPLKYPNTEITNFSVVIRDILTNLFSNLKSQKRIDRYTKYNSLGDFELKSEKLISSSHFGNLDNIKQLLTDSPAPNVNVTDCYGSFSLLEATLTWNTELIDYLLDSGANINYVTDEGVSALGSCMLFYYPQHGFIETIAESIVLLDATPFNFNGVRREPSKKLESTGDNDTGNLNNDILHGFKANDDPINSESKIEDWNDYQKDMINRKLSQKESTYAFGKIVENKINDDNSLNFDSSRNCIEYNIKVNDHLLEKAASALSLNNKIIDRQPRPNSCYQEISNNEGIARFKALKISRCNQMLKVIQLLLRRGADPNICQIPFSALFFAVKSGDIEMTKLLISKGSNVNACLRPENRSLTLLHISSCLPGPFGIIITELLLKSGAKPNSRALDDDSFLDKTLMDEWNKDILTDEQLSLIGGKTPLHLACSRYDDFKVSHNIAKLLLEYDADPNLICNGHTPLTLAIASGNDLIVDEILNNKKLLINLSLTHGLGSALCVSSSTSYEHTRTIESRLLLIKKLISSGADLLSPVLVGIKRNPGIVSDYAYYIFNLDQRVAHLPYHALTSIERDLFNNRRMMLNHLGMFTREKAVEKEKKRLETLKVEERSPSPEFIYTGAGAETGNRISTASKHLPNLESQMQGAELLARKPLLKYCYECGRSINVKLTACTRCKEVYFCSKLCKTKAWTARHKSECLRVGARVSSSGSERKNNRNVDSPTPATIGEDPNILQEQGRIKSQNQLLIKKDPSQLKEKLNQGFSQFNLTQNANSHPRRLPPLNLQGHPSYSYAYIMGQYVKIDNLGRIVTLDQNALDNYSFE